MSRFVWDNTDITITKRASTREKGGEGSGFEGHEGRPGKVGGSAPRRASRRMLSAEDIQKFDLRGEYREWWDGLSEGEKNAIRAYQGGDYWDINSKMRFGTDPATDNFRIRWGKDVEEIVLDLKELFRTDAISGDFSDAPVYRGMEAITPDLMRELKNVGGMFTDDGFVSASKLKEYAEAFSFKSPAAAMITIRTPRGIPMPFLPLNGTEHEILFPPGTVFRILSAEAGAGGRLEVEIEATYGEE